MTFLLIFVFLAAGYGLMVYASCQEKLRQQKRATDRQHQEHLKSQKASQQQETQQREQARLKEIWREEGRQQIRDTVAQRLENDRLADKSYTPSQVSISSAPRSTETLKRSSTVTRQIKSKLEKLCGSDYRLAQRLVEGLRVDHPDRSEQWCWEKAVRDMERDRGR